MNADIIESYCFQFEISLSGEDAFRVHDLTVLHGHSLYVSESIGLQIRTNDDPAATAVGLALRTLEERLPHVVYRCTSETTVKRTPLRARIKLWIGFEPSDQPAVMIEARNKQLEAARISAALIRCQEAELLVDLMGSQYRSLVADAAPSVDDLSEFAERWERDDWSADQIVRYIRAREDLRVLEDAARDAGVSPMEPYTGIAKNVDREGLVVGPLGLVLLPDGVLALEKSGETELTVASATPVLKAFSTAWSPSAQNSFAIDCPEELTDTSLPSLIAHLNAGESLTIIAGPSAKDDLVRTGPEPVDAPRQHDVVDARLLTTLTQGPDAGLSAVYLARSVGRHPSTVRARLARLLALFGASRMGGMCSLPSLLVRRQANRRGYRVGGSAHIAPPSNWSDVGWASDRGRSAGTRRLFFSPLGRHLGPIGDLACTR